jgi:hypothetical protein
MTVNQITLQAVSEGRTHRRSSPGRYVEAQRAELMLILRDASARQRLRLMIDAEKRKVLRRRAALESERWSPQAWVD